MVIYWNAAFRSDSNPCYSIHQNVPCRWRWEPARCFCETTCCCVVALPWHCCPPVYDSNRDGLSIARHSFWLDAFKLRKPTDASPHNIPAYRKRVCDIAGQSEASHTGRSIGCVCLPQLRTDLQLYFYPPEIVRHPYQPGALGFVSEITLSGACQRLVWTVFPRNSHSFINLRAWRRYEEWR